MKRSFIIFLIIRLCVSQSTSTALCSTCTAAPTCYGCNVNADVITTSGTFWTQINLAYGLSSTSSMNYNPAADEAMLQASLLFTAYSVTSKSSVSGNCINIKGSPVPLFDYTQVFPVPLTVQSANYSSFLDDTYSSFYAKFGYEGCTPVLQPSQVLPAYQGIFTYPNPATALPSTTPAEISATTFPSATSTEDSVPVRHLNSAQIIIISVVVPITGLTILLLCLIVIRRYRKKRSHATSTNQSGVTSDTQLYVDQKAELEDEERRKQELDGEGVRYEMEGDDRMHEMHEMPGNASTPTELASYMEIHELRDEEHSRELEVPSNI